MLCEVSGMDGCSLQPSAGAQGELTGLMMLRAWHASKGRSPKKVLIPESAHGTNPATCALNGLTAVKIDKNAEAAFSRLRSGDADGVPCCIDLGSTRHDEHHRRSLARQTSAEMVEQRVERFERRCSVAEHNGVSVTSA